MEQKLLTERDAYRFKRFVKCNYWQFAKTYASFCPHEYTLKKWDKTGDFEWFCNCVIKNGFVARYGKKKSMYFVDAEERRYYFVPFEDIGENEEIKPTVILINRASLDDWELVQEGEDIIAKFKGK